jgi:cell division protein FtsW (lipid II flippase)
MIRLLVLIVAALAVFVVLLVVFLFSASDQSSFQRALSMVVGGLLALLFVMILEQIRKTASRWRTPRARLVSRRRRH